MEQFMWLICEFEDESKAFTEFTVSSVPENWFVTINGILYCYWPKKNVEQKIRRQTCPKEGNNWTTYKCRVLMEGAKFPTYKEAVEAEKIAQSFTIVEDVNQEENESQNCDSTMDFDVSSISDESEFDTDGMCENTVGLGPFYKKIRTSDWNISDISEDYQSDFKPNSAGFFTSTLLDDNEIEREFETNDKKKVRLLISTIEWKASSFIADLGSYIKQIQELVEENENNDASSVVSTNVKTSSVDSHDSEKTQIYKNIPNLNKTVYEEEARRPYADEDFDQQQIKSVEKRGRLALTDETFRVDQPPANEAYLAEIVHFGKGDRKALADETFRVDQPPANENLSDGYLGEIVHFDQPTVEPHERSVRVSCPVVTTHFDQTSTDEYPARMACINETFCFDQPPNDSHGRPTGEAFPFDRSPAESHERTDHEGDQNAGPLKVKILHIEEVQPSVGVEDDTLNGNEPPKEKTEKIRLPVKSIPHFNQTEELLHENANLGDALIEHLLPYEFESEANYMNRTILTVFCEKFLLKHVSWKVEKDRVLIKNSDILRCWKESYASRFPPDDDDSKFVGHFRRLKQTLRAAEKAQAKKAQKNVRAHRKN